MKEEFCLSSENKVALVTGAGSDMGLATAKAFADAGASVVLADANEESGAVSNFKVCKAKLNIDGRFALGTTCN